MNGPYVPPSWPPVWLAASWDSDEDHQDQLDARDRGEEKSA